MSPKYSLFTDWILVPETAPARSRAPGRFYDACRVLWRWIFLMTMRTKCSGLQDVDIPGGVLVAVSHVGHMDPIVVGTLMRRRIGWVSRIEFYQHWFMRPVLHHGGAFQVDRKGPALPTIREGLKRLERGEAVGIFPEGELMRGNDSVLRGADIKEGVCVLAARSGKPVLPVVVIGTDKLEKVDPWLPAKRGRLWIHCGQPIHADRHDTGREGRARFARRLVAEYTRLYAEAREKFDLPESVVP